MNNAYISGINGSVVKVSGDSGLQMMEMVYVGKEKLKGEVIGVHEDHAVVQVYEETAGLSCGEKVEPLGKPLSAMLAPGIIGNIFDGIGRLLKDIETASGSFIKRGLEIPSVDTQKLWETKILVTEGDEIYPGTVLAEIKETDSVIHKVMVPPDICGVVVEAVINGKYKVTDTIVKYKNSDGEILPLTIVQYWPVRKPRPILKRKLLNQPLVTGQRVIDTLFPVAKGGTTAIPGGFGTGKTMTQHQFAKWSDADIIVYIGCGERGNEMTQVLEEFSALTDPRTGKPLLERTVLIANTSNMPVAAREASVYTGITIAEYYRDMGYDVAIMADSTSRWAEALREISGRLEEMPAEEGFPAYLSSRLAQFYERAGSTVNLNGTNGSVTVIGAVSPQGGDFSEPVTQNTKRFVRCFLGLDRSLAYSRHYPSINWITSYSEYVGDLTRWYCENVAPDYMQLRARIVKILNEENKLMEIVKLIGGDVLPDNQKLVLEIARVIRLGFLQQNAYNKNDTYAPLQKQYKMMQLILRLNDVSAELVEKGVPYTVLKSKCLFDEVIKMKYEISNNELNKFDTYMQKVEDFKNEILSEYKDII